MSSGQTPRNTTVSDALLAIEEVVGAEALALLRNGTGRLFVWRRSSPHNWWVAPRRKDYEHAWHSDGWGDRPPLQFFLVENQSDSKVESHTVVPRWERGLSESTVYVLRPEYMTAQGRRNLSRQTARRAA